MASTSPPASPVRTWPLLAAALLVAVTGLGFAWSTARCDDGARE